MKRIPLALCLVIALVAGACGGGTSSPTIPIPAADRAVFDALQRGCADGDYTMCDVLYQISPADSSYEAFGDSCGDRNEPSAYCVDIYGVEVDLDALEGACTGGDMLACDKLYVYSDAGSAQEDVGYTCGGRDRDALGCVLEYGMPEG